MNQFDSYLSPVIRCYYHHSCCLVVRKTRHKKDKGLIQGQPESGVACQLLTPPPCLLCPATLEERPGMSNASAECCAGWKLGVSPPLGAQEGRPRRDTCALLWLQTQKCMEPGS